MFSPVNSTLDQDRVNAAKVDRCKDCDRRMAHTRRCPLPAGTIRHKAHGYCSGCYNRIVRGTGEVDPITVERLIAGSPPLVVRRGERLIAAKELSRRGLSARQIAERIQVTPRTVVRYRVSS